MNTERSQPEQRPGKEGDKGTIPHFESAIQRNSASFAMLLEALYGRLEKFQPNAAERLAKNQYYPQLLTAFEAEHGAIRELFCCSNIAAGTVLTSKAGLHTVYPLAEGSEVEEVLFECERIRVEAQRLLKGQDLQTVMRRLYSAITDLLAILDAMAQPATEAMADQNTTAKYGRPLRLLSDDVLRTEQYSVRSAERNAQIDYFLGMLMGLCVVIVLAGILLAIFILLDLRSGPFVGSLIAGGFGAIVSVLSRMTFGRLVLNYDAGSALLRLLGGFRPVIGSVFGAVIFVLASSGLVPIAVPENASKQLYFYPGIGFIAGFSERFAQDMLVVARRSIAATDQGEAEQPSEKESSRGAPDKQK